MHFYPHFCAFCNVKLANDHTFPLYFGIKDNAQPPTSNYPQAHATQYRNAPRTRHIYTCTHTCTRIKKKIIKKKDNATKGTPTTYSKTPLTRN